MRRRGGGGEEEGRSERELLTGEVFHGSLLNLFLKWI
jgi:hypothetical protein